MGSAGLVFVVVALIAYASATAIFVLHLASKKAALAQIGLRVLIFGSLAHLVAQVLRFLDVGAMVALSKTDSLHILSLALGICFIVIARRYKVPALGAFAAPLCVVALGAWVAFDSVGGGAIPEALRTIWLPFHIGLLIAAEALFVVAGVASIAYLIQDYSLKKKKLGPVFRNLPSLHVLDEVTHRTIVIGWVLLSAGMVAGARQAKLEWGAYWQWDPRQSVTALIWLLFAGILHARLITGWRGRRAVYITLFSVVVVIASHLWLDVFFDTLHVGDYQ